MNWTLPDVQAGFRKGKEAEIKLPTFVGSQKKQNNSRKTSISALLATLNPVAVQITTIYGKFLKRWKYQTTWSVSWESYLQVKKQQLELHMEQKTGSKLWKEYNKAICCHPAYLTSMQSTSFEMLGWMKQKLYCQKKYQQPQICRWYHPNGRNQEELKSCLMKVNQKNEKDGLQLNIQKMKVMASDSIPSICGK